MHRLRRHRDGVTLEDGRRFTILQRPSHGGARGSDVVGGWKHYTDVAQPVAAGKDDRGLLLSGRAVPGVTSPVADGVGIVVVIPRPEEAASVTVLTWNRSELECPHSTHPRSVLDVDVLADAIKVL